jgi:hypothetical protein
MQVPPVSRRALCVLALGAAACGVLASAPEAIDKTPKCKRGQLLVKVGKKRVCKRTATGNWAKFGTGMPILSVLDLTTVPGTTTIVAATHGRGIWTLPA